MFSKVPGSIETRYYHTDVIGSVRAITDEVGAVVIRRDYAPFGEDNNPDLPGDPMRFAGKELDPETGMNYFAARYYRNTWGRFTSVDPVMGRRTNPQSFNRYAYALNNPLRFVDPTGLEPGTWYRGSGTDGCMYGGTYPTCAGQYTGPGNRVRVSGDLFCETYFNEGIEYGYFNCSTGSSPEDSASNGGGGGSTDNGSGPCGSCGTMEDTGPDPDPAPDPDPDPDPPTPVVVAQGPRDPSTYLRWAQNVYRWVTGLPNWLRAAQSTIKMSDSRILHVLELHVGQGSPGKSVFFGGRDEVIALIKAAATHPAALQQNGRLQRVVNAGRMIGIDRATNAPTSTYTVITTTADELVTAFPGMP